MKLHKGGRARSWTGAAPAEAIELSQVTMDCTSRLRVSSQEVNRAFGGGIVPGSLTLIAGDPGIGKSTLLLRIAADAAAGGTTLYVSGEESPAQVRMRADRMSISGDGLFLLGATQLDEVLGHLDRRRPSVAVVDSVQTLYDTSVSSEPGGVAQTSECTRRLLEWAKSTGVPVLLSGHVTKGGQIAGPRLLEHMVDVVLYMEGETVGSYRLLRTVKNRFGSTNEIGVFEMTSEGLRDVLDPSMAFLADRRPDAVGSVIVSAMEGSRPLLVEVQALTAPTALPTPRRVATGVDHSRLLLVCAVLSRRVGLPLSNQDVLVNVAGGLRVGEPAVDLGIALAIVSSFRDEGLGPDLAAVGEVGLSGEVRAVPQLERRIGEVERLGLGRCLVPETPGGGDGVGSLRTIRVDSLTKALSVSLGPRGRRARRETGLVSA
jgi:DNA repair protein RadA/Sms